MKKLLTRLSLVTVLVLLLYGVTALRGIRVPVLDTCFSYGTYPLLVFQNMVVTPIKQYIEMLRIHHEMENICMQSLQERQELLRQNIELQTLLDVSNSVNELEDFKKRYSCPSITVHVLSRHFESQRITRVQGPSQGIMQPQGVQVRAPAQGTAAETDAQDLAQGAGREYVQNAVHENEHALRAARRSTALYERGLVNVRGQGHDGPAHFFLIDAGTNRGIEIDMVVVYKNCLVGRVIEVYPHYSKVILITDPRCKVAVFCKDSHDQAIHEGTGSLAQTQLTYVFDSRLDLEKRLKKGDLVISSGEGLIFPKGFGLGTIDSFHADELLFFVALKPLLDFRTIDYCSVILKGAEYTELAEPVKTKQTSKSTAKQTPSPEPVKTKPAQKSEAIKQPKVSKPMHVPAPHFSGVGPKAEPVEAIKNSAEVPVIERVDRSERVPEIMSDQRVEQTHDGAAAPEAQREVAVTQFESLPEHGTGRVDSPASAQPQPGDGEHVKSGAGRSHYAFTPFNPDDSE